MKLNNAKDIRLGNAPIQKVYLGKHLIWPEIETQSEPLSVLPDGYTRLSAIESTSGSGTTMLQLLYLQNTSKLVIDYEIAQQSSSSYQYCVFASVIEAWMWRVIALTQLSGEWMSRLSVFMPSGSHVISNGDPVKAGVRYLMTAEDNYCEFVPMDKSEDAVRIESDYSLNITSMSGIYINSYRNQVNGWAKGARYYSVKHYVDGNLENDYVPVLYRDSGDIEHIGMYDTVKDHFTECGSNRWSPIYLP